MLGAVLVGPDMGSQGPDDGRLPFVGGVGKGALCGSPGRLFRLPRGGLPRIRNREFLPWARDTGPEGLQANGSRQRAIRAPVTAEARCCATGFPLSAGPDQIREPANPYSEACGWTCPVGQGLAGRRLGPLGSPGCVTGFRHLWPSGGARPGREARGSWLWSSRASSAHPLTTPLRSAPQQPHSWAVQDGTFPSWIGPSPRHAEAPNARRAARMVRSNFRP